MSAMILITTVTAATIGAGGNPDVYFAGSTISDANVQAAVLAVGGVLAPATDPILAAAAAVVTSLRNSTAIDEHRASAIMTAAMAGVAYGEVPQRVTVDVPLATIQAQTSGTAFNVGSALPANARLLNAEVNVLTPVSGGTLSAVTVKLEGGTDTAGSILGGASGLSVFTGASAVVAGSGSNPYQSRGGQQVKMTLTATGDTLADATAGHLSVDLFYSVTP
jgi:hypothetical protein